MGYIQKLLENVRALIEGGQNVDGLIETALTLLRGGCDANPNEWEILNNAIAKAAKSAGDLAAKDAPKVTSKHK